jgi:S-DNA-T family DNA segregation ATPase FtsK/SpoIIIE
MPTPVPPRPPAATLQKERNSMLAAAGLGEGSLPAGIRYSLAFLSGPQASTVRQLAKPSTIIGREEGDVIINDPETSRKHARIDIHSDGTAWITDLGSTNGTSLAGRIIDGPTQLLDRQEFSCGKSTFMLLIRALDPPSVD